MNEKPSPENPRHPGRSDGGAVAILVAILLPVFVVLTAVALDIGRWYVEIGKVQSAADAAALAGATWLPHNFDAPPSGNAKKSAIAAAAQNGYPDSGTSSVEVLSMPDPNELLVTITSTIPNVFGAIFGNPTTTIRRSSLSDFHGSALMGSPCNTFGNEPDSTSGAAAPIGTSIPTTANGGYATCQSRNPNFWAAIEGPATEKHQGDRYSTKNCSNGTPSPSNVDGCASNVNTENANYVGYYYIVRVGDTVGNNPVTIQLYDPAYVESGSDCTNLPSDLVDAVNPYSDSSDSNTRYYADVTTPTGTSSFCPGDSDPGGSGTQPAMVTSFVLRKKTLTYDPTQAAVIPTCVKQYGARTSVPTKNSLTLGNASYVPGLAKVFHQWVTMCTFYPADNGGAGDYYLQVRTNASTGGVTADSGSDGLIYTDSATASSPTETETAGRGANGFGVRAIVGDTASQPNPLNAAVSVAGWDRMPMFQNAPGETATFNLLQVDPNAAGKYIAFDLFDVGDATGAGSVEVLRPIEQYTTDTSSPYYVADKSLPGCTTSLSGGTPVALGANCVASISSASNNGRTEVVTIPVPPGYACDDTSVGGCWFRVKVTFPGASSVTDFTTWNGSILGDVVRLLE